MKALTGSLVMPDELTPREREILVALAQGHTRIEIAASLSIGLKTFDTHRLNLLKKLGLGNVADLTRYAIKQGLIDVDGNELSALENQPSSDLPAPVAQPRSAIAQVEKSS